jgi:phosphoribosylaminoimidazole-succinocarboxamide synthase
LAVESSALSVEHSAMQIATQSSIELPGVKKLRSGKVREVFDLGDTLLFVVSDRISAFDVILPDPIPYKGAVLNQISAFWFRRFSDIRNHVVTADFDEFPQELQKFREQLFGRSMIVKKTRPLPVECVVRGYLAGSGWREYQQSQSVCGIKLPANLEQASQLPEPIFTPATKAETGHDENIDMKRCVEILGEEIADRVKTLSLEIYSRGRDHAAQRGILVADTKFEFGTVNGELLLIDECLTPDSSRFWPVDEYVVGQSPPSFDKQFVRDYLETLDWDKTPPAPRLPKGVIEKTSAKYLEAFRRLTGSELATA